MRIANQGGVSLASVEALIQNSVPPGSLLAAYFDDRQNRTRRDEAAGRIAGNLSRGWQPNAWDVDLVDKPDGDWHAVFCAAEIVRTQAIPEYVKAALRSGESLIYLDNTITASDSIFLVTTVAHECRHAWQYFVHPVIYFGHNVLNFIIPPQSLPAEIDAELFAKRTAIEQFGEEMTLAYAHKRLESAPDDQTWFWQRLIDLDPSHTIDCRQATEELLLERGKELRKEQEKLNVTIPLLEKAASYLSQAQRAQFLASATRRE